MSEATRREAMVRMATDPAFAARVRTAPDDVARECDLSAEDLAALNALEEATSAGGPDVLGERLSKSAIFSGGVLSSLFGHQQAAPDVTHDDTAVSHHIEHPGDRAGAARTQEFNTPDEAHEGQGWMLDDGRSPDVASLIGGHHGGVGPGHDGGNPAAAGGDGDGLRPIVVPPGSLSDGETSFLSGGHDHGSVSPVHDGGNPAGGGDGHGAKVLTIGDEAGRPGGGQTFGGGGETASGGTGGDQAGAVMYPPVMNPTDPGHHSDVIPHHDNAAGKDDGGDKGDKPIKPDDGPKPPKLEDFGSRVDNPQDVSHSTAHDNAAGKDDGGDKGDKPIKPDDGPKPPKLEDFISHADASNVAHASAAANPSAVTFDQASPTAP